MLRAPFAIYPAVLAACVLAAGCSSTPEDKTAGWTTDRIYSEAREELSGGSYDKAVPLLEKLEGRAAGTPLAQQAQLDKAYAHYKGGEKAQAIAALDRFMKLHPASPALDYALYFKGVVNFNETMGFLSGISRQDLSERDQQAARDSYQAFEQLVQAFPESKYSDDARARMGYIVNSLAEYELHVARYYFRRQAFLAAANRAQLAVREYPQTPAVEEALYIMAASYDKLGLEQLRADAERVLIKNYPNTRYIKNGVRVPERAWWQFW